MAAVQLVLNHHECVLALLEGLAVEELSQLGQVLTVEPDSHGQVLVGCCELVADLLIQKVVERLGHMVSPYMVVAFRRRDGAVQPVGIYRTGYCGACTERKG